MLRKTDLGVILIGICVLLPHSVWIRITTSTKTLIHGPTVRNVVLICTDTVRYDSFWLPETKGKKDLFSEWEQKAIRFRNVQSAASWTVPSVASVLTGLYPVEHGAGKFSQPIADLGHYTPVGLTDRIPVISKILADEGFDSYAFSASPFINFLLQGRNTLPGTKKRWGDREIEEQATLWLHNFAEKKHDKPFFLYLHMLAAHDGHWQPLDVIRKQNRIVAPTFSDEIIRSAPGGICTNPNSEFCDRYQAYIRGILMERNEIARVLKALKDENLLQETVVILFSDHGEEFEDHAQQELALDPDAQTHGHGHSLYQELIHVPLLIWHPQYSGRDIQAQVTLVDIAPTLMDWLSIKTDSLHYSGVSLARIQDLDTRTDLPKRTIYASGIAYGHEKIAVRSGNWKMIRIDEGAAFLYNLDFDPLERKALPYYDARYAMNEFANLYRMKPERQEKIHYTLNGDEQEALRSIGYLSVGGQP